MKINNHQSCKIDGLQFVAKYSTDLETVEVYVLCGIYEGGSLNVAHKLI